MITQENITYTTTAEKTENVFYATAVCSQRHVNLFHFPSFFPWYKFFSRARKNTETFCNLKLNFQQGVSVSSCAVWGSRDTRSKHRPSPCDWGQSFMKHAAALTKTNRPYHWPFLQRIHPQSLFWMQFFLNFSFGCWDSQMTNFNVLLPLWAWHLRLLDDRRILYDE